MADFQHFGSVIAYCTVFGNPICTTTGVGGRDSGAGESSARSRVTQKACLERYREVGLYLLILEPVNRLFSFILNLHIGIMIGGKSAPFMRKVADDEMIPPNPGCA